MTHSHEPPTSNTSDEESEQNKDRTLHPPVQSKRFAKPEEDGSGELRS
jgi:hypothetical protein